NSPFFICIEAGIAILSTNHIDLVRICLYHFAGSKEDVLHEVDFTKLSSSPEVRMWRAWHRIRRGSVRLWRHVRDNRLSWLLFATFLLSLLIGLWGGSEYNERQCRAPESIISSANGNQGHVTSNQY